MACVRVIVLEILALVVGVSATGTSKTTSPPILEGSLAAEALARIGANLEGSHLSLQEEQEAELEIQKNFLHATFDVNSPIATLFMQPNCTGATIEVASDSSENLCKHCFDVCNKTFNGGNGSMAAIAGSGPLPQSRVRSLLVHQGCVRSLGSYCRGQWSAEDEEESGQVFTGLNYCVNFEEGLGPVHLDLGSCAKSLEATDLYFAFHDAGRDGALNASEAADLKEFELFNEMDLNKDDLVQKAEYIAFMGEQQFKHKVVDHVLDASAYLDMARSYGELESTGTSAITASQVEHAAAQLYGEEFQKAELSEEARPTLSSLTNASAASSVGQVLSGSDLGDRICRDGRSSEWSSLACTRLCDLAHRNALGSWCWADCPSGTTDIGAYCAEKFFKWQKKPNWYRGPGRFESKCELGDSFGPGSSNSEDLTRFTIGIVSDMQLPWAYGKPKGDVPKAIEENRYLIQGIHRAKHDLTWTVGTEEPVEDLLGVILNGDLTSYGHDWQFKLYRQLWETNPNARSEDNLKLPIWMTLGNHDIANNLEKCKRWYGFGKNACANRMLAYMRSAVTGCKDGSTVVPSFGGRVDHYDRASAAYTVKYGRLRAVFLQNYPSYGWGSDVDVGIAQHAFSAGMDFLKKEVKLANEIGAYLIVFFHDLGDNFPDKNNNPAFVEFFDIVQDSRIVGFFAGHWHMRGGMRKGSLKEKNPAGYVSRVARNAWGDEIPVYRDWAAEYQRFLLFQYNEAECYWRIGSAQADNKSGPVRWYGEGDNWRYKDDNGQPGITSSGDPYQNANWDARLYFQKNILRNCTPVAEHHCPLGVCGGDCRSCPASQSCIDSRCRAWTPWMSTISKETPNTGYAASGFGCKEGHCREVRLRYDQANSVSGLSDWAEWVSDVSDNRISACPADHAVVQVACKGTKCSNVRVRCGYVGQLGEEWVSDWFSEEGSGEALCPQNGMITKVECHEQKCLVGSNCKWFCDDKRIYCSGKAAAVGIMAMTIEEGTSGEGTGGGQTSSDSNGDGDQTADLKKGLGIVDGAHDLHMPCFAVLLFAVLWNHMALPQLA